MNDSAVIVFSRYYTLNILTLPDMGIPIKKTLSSEKAIGNTVWFPNKYFYKAVIVINYC